MDRIQLRRDSSARWAEINPILLEGEVGYETDTKLRKIGDGVHRWNELEYLKAENILQETGNSEEATMSQKAITNGFTNLVSEIKGYKTEIYNKIASQDNVIDNFKEDITNQVNNYRPIEINGNVTNAADEEDITSENGLLKLKNRNNLNGMGYIVLRKNKTFAEQLTQTNTIYEIRYGFDLNDEEVTIPEGCTLKFEGGWLENGSINGILNIESAPVRIFKEIKIKGSVVNEIYVEWFGAKGDGITDDSSAINDSLSMYNRIRLRANTTYRVEDVIKLPYKCSILGNYSSCVSLSENSLFLLGSNTELSNMFIKQDVSTTAIRVTSEWIQGSYDEYDSSNTAWKYRNYANVKAHDIDIMCISDELTEHNCIEVISNGLGTGFWGVDFYGIQIYGRHKYGLYFNNGVTQKATKATWATDITCKNIRIRYAQNGVYLGKTDENTSYGGFPVERVSFENVSMQYHEEVSERFAVIEAANRASFINCEPWDWKNYKAYIVNPNKTKGIVINGGSSDDKDMCFDLSEYPLHNNSVPTCINMVNANTGSSYDIGYVIRRDASEGKMTIKEALALPSGTYLIGNDSKFATLLGIKNDSIGVVGFDNCVLEVTSLRNNGKLLKLYFSANGSRRNHCSSVYCVIGSRNPSDEPIPDWIESQPRVKVYNDITSFIDKNIYRYKYLGLVGGAEKAKLAFKVYDSLALDAFGQMFTDNNGTNRPTGLNKTRDVGKSFFDTNIKKPLWWNGIEWVNASGNNPDIHISTYGLFEDKPVSPQIGFAYFCSNKQTVEGGAEGIVIYHKGDNVWVDSLGRIVE